MEMEYKKLFAVEFVKVNGYLVFMLWICTSFMKFPPKLKIVSI